jgi:hypothetical protein
MKMPAEKKAILRDSKIGDIFQISIDEERFVLGQVIDQYKATLLVLVFDKVFPRNSDIIFDFNALSPVLLACTFDALLYNGTWPVVRNDTTDLADLRRPEFLIGPNENCSVEDFHGRTIRKATAHDLEHLGYRTIVSPIRVQKAAQALNGIGEWMDSFDVLKAKR